MKIGMRNISVLLDTLFAPNKLRRWLLVLLVGFATLASYWALEIIRSQGGAGAKSERTRPDYFVENFNYVKMLPSGQSQYRIVGTKLFHYSNDDHADVTLPVITNLDPTRPSMTARSERAVLKNIANQTEHEVHLYEKVVLNRPKTATAEHLKLNTEYLLAYPDKDTAETHLPVQILSGDSVTTGVGMKANNATQEIEILKDVYTIIPPQTAQKKNTAQ
jgi:lipopolysaccharide export system protein LptC